MPPIIPAPASTQGSVQILVKSAYDEAEKCNCQYIVLEIDDALTGINRDELVNVLWAENVIARRYFFPGCHRMEPYRSHFPHTGLLLPETERLVKRVLSLPTGTAVGPDEISRICQIIRLVVENGQEVQAELQRRSEIVGASRVGQSDG